MEINQDVNNEQPSIQGGPQQQPKQSKPIGWAILSFFLPLVGLILFLVWRKTKPQAAKWSGIAAIIGFVIGLIGIFLSPDTAEEPVDTATQVEEPVSTPEADTEPVAETPVVSEPEPEPEPEPSMTVSQENAVDKAESYLAYTAFSKKGLIEQLEFEGFPKEDAKFAVDYIDVDWKEQAAEKAQSYMDYSSFSRQGLIDQLKFEGFTDKQAKHGADSVGL